MTLWRRFRALPAAAQAATWLGVAAVYTVALVLILGGGGDRDGGDGGAPSGSPEAARKKLDPKERKIAGEVEGAKVKAVEANDVPEFRKPQVQTVDCKDDACTIDYTSGLPGRGRIFEDQQRMLAAIYKDESVNTVLMRVYRAAAVGPGTPAKAAEETSPGSPILITRCRRTDKPARADAGSNVKVPPVPASCESLPLSQASNNASPDSAAASQPPPDSSNGGSGEGGILGGG